MIEINGRRERKPPRVARRSVPPPSTKGRSAIRGRVEDETRHRPDHGGAGAGTMRDLAYTKGE